MSDKIDNIQVARVERDKALGFNGGQVYQKPNESMGAREKLMLKTQHARKKTVFNTLFVHNVNNVVINLNLDLIEEL